MSSVYFDPALGGDGTTVTDDADPATGLAQGGHRTRFVPSLAQSVAVAGFVLTKADEAASSEAAAAASESNADQSKQDAYAYAQDAATQTGLASAQADRAESEADRAEEAASLAASTTPNAAIRINPRTITENTTIPGGHNGLSAGPIAIGNNIAVTVADNATWSIV
ncbi:hypothetical protein [Spongiibacter marinus]|uniref:hypothetical protein n=1 Tax=Spongiibacter marinus TaxID=354246 RepID=UPI00195F9489|nr:hypothetical protein [Spongiibacter marinus]MBM7425070.1 hypothetical protein [Spongiibacter marinus]